ncbi:hypothetical protein [Haliscomenobacter sp.]|uniref:hypothetical protein n=1 Tax=Haliscomenobacter sp. TaxID=2717303 RepID=UPI00359405F1
MEAQIINTSPGISKTRLTLLKSANILFFLLCIGFNFLAVFLPLNNKTTQELSDQYPNLFTPAGLTFSIWSLIYLLLLFFSVWQIWPLRSAQRRLDRNRAIDALGWRFVFVSFLNMAWLFCWHYEFVSASIVVMFLMLFQLIRVNRQAFYILPHTQDYRNFLQIPFGLYLGWISVASIANVTAWLKGAQWDGGGLSEKLWTVMMILVAIALSLGMLFVRRNIPYALAVTWALFGISLKHQELFNTSLSTIIFTAYAGIAILLIVIAVKLRPWWNRAVIDSTLATPPLFPRLS